MFLGRGVKATRRRWLRMPGSCGSRWAGNRAIPICERLSSTPGISQSRVVGYPFNSARPNLVYGWFGTFDHRVIGCWRRAHGLLHQPEEELAAAFRPPAIEAKSEFIQVVRQMPRCHCALVDFCLRNRRLSMTAPAVRKTIV